MSSETYERIRNNPRFTELVERRSRFAWLLTGFIFVVFFSFLYGAAFGRELVSVRPFAGSNMNIFILFGLFQFVVFWFLAFLYVRRANGEFDDLTNEIVDSAGSDA